MNAAITVTNAFVRFGELTAVNGVSLAVPEGTCFGIVGESGSGKTTLMRAILGLQKLDEGEIRIAGRVLGTDRAGLKERASIIQPIFQDPAASLSPRCRIGTLMDEVGTVLKEPRDGTRQRLNDILRKLGINPDVADKYPHEISGGQARRVAIARALLMRSTIIVADEPTAGLDVSVQGDLLNLLQELRKTERVTMVVISHNLAVVRLIAENAVVMKKGSVVESGDVETLFKSPQHPYTRELIDSWPDVIRTATHNQQR